MLFTNTALIPAYSHAVTHCDYGFANVMKLLAATMSILALVPVERIVAEDTDARVPAVERAVDPQPGDSGSVPVRLREEQHYPLHQSGGLAVPSADLEEYLKTLQARATARTFLLTFHDVLFEPAH